MAEVIQKWASFSTRVSEAIVFVPEDWKTTEGRQSRKRLEALLAEADTFSREHQDFVRFEFEPYVREEINAIKEKWNTIDAEAAAALPTTTVADLPSTAAPSVTVASTRKRKRERRKGGTRKGKKMQPVSDLGVLGADGTLDDGTKLGKIFPPIPCEQCEAPPRRTCTGQLGVTCDECRLRQLSCSFGDPAAPVQGTFRPQSLHSPAPQQAIISAFPPPNADIARAGGTPEFTATSSHRALQREISYEDVASASASAPIAMTHEDVQMTDIESRKGMAYLPPPVCSSHGDEPSEANPLEAIRHLSIDPDGFRPTLNTTSPTIFNAPTTVEDMKQRREVVHATYIRQIVVSAKALQVFSAENKKQAELVAENAFLSSLVSQAGANDLS